MGRNIGEMIKMLRDSKNLTRKQFCDIVEISTSGLQYYERGDRRPSGKVLHKIKQGFGLPTDYFSEELANANTKENFLEHKDKGRLSMNQQNRLIDYQESEIQQLKQENLALKKNSSMTIDGMLDTSYQFSMNCEFELSISTLSVKIKYTKAISNFDYIVKKLGYSKDTLSNDIFSFGKSINYKDHTIHLLRSPNAKSDMLKIANKIIKSMALTRDTMFSYNLKVPVTYQTKNGKPVHAMNQYVVNWIEKTAIANIHFMNGVD